MVRSLQSHSSTCLPGFIEDASVVALKAHSLKGLSSTFEAIPFMQLAATIESQASVADQVSLVEAIPQLQFEFERLINDLKSVV